MLNVMEQKRIMHIDDRLREKQHKDNNNFWHFDDRPEVVEDPLFGHDPALSDFTGSPTPERLINPPTDYDANNYDPFNP